MAKAKKTAAKKTATKKSGGSIEKTYQAIKDAIVLLDEDFEKFLVDENKSAGRRVRGHAQLIKKSCQELRKQVMELHKKRKG